MKSASLPALHSLGSQRNLKLNIHWSTAERRQVQQLCLTGKDDLQQDHVSGIREFQIEVMKFRDVRTVDPQIVLVADPLAKVPTLHRFSSNVERNFGQNLFGQIEVLEGVLPTLFIRPLG